MIRAYLRTLRPVVASAGLLACSGPGLAQVGVEQLPSAPASRPVTGVYRCMGDGATILADRPCGPEAVREGVVPVAPGSYTPPVPPPPGSGARRRSPSPASVSAPGGAPARSPDAERRMAECRRIGRKLSVLESRMRAGYSGAQGEKLRAQQRQLAGSRYDLRCRTPELRFGVPP